MARMNRIWKMYILFSFVVVLAMTVAGFVLQRQLKRSLYSHLEEDVLTLARALARALPATDKPLEYGSWCDDYGSATGVRITLIAEDGKVVCDSLEKGIVGAGRLLERCSGGRLSQWPGSAGLTRPAAPPAPEQHRSDSQRLSCAQAPAGLRIPASGQAVRRRNPARQA